MSKESEQFVEEKGKKCPICKSDNIQQNGALKEATHWGCQDVLLEKPMTCNNCPANWDIYYSMEGYYNVVNDDGHELGVRTFEDMMG